MTPQPNGLEGFEALAEADRGAAGRLLREVKRRALVPHAGQQQVLSSNARFKVIRAGRRWGKTKLAARELIREAIQNPGTVNWWVANRWRNTRRGYKEVLKQLPPQLLAKPAPAETSNELTLYLKNGSSIEFYSGESPDSLAGAGVNFVVVDEAALGRFGDGAVWHQLIRPTLMDTNGRAMLISTPRGKNYFHDLWYRGQDPEVPDTESWWFPQSSNPYIPAEETEAARLDLPDVIFRQEIMAEFVSAAASIFEVGDGIVVPGIVDPEGTVFMGVDLAKKEDFTVIDAVREHDRLPVYHDRFNSVSWPDQKDAILVARDTIMEAGAEHVVVAIDGTGIGDYMVDELELEDIDLVPIKFSNAWKLKAVKDLGAALAQRQAFILEEQRSEFESYEYEISDAGNYTFQAGVGHDDEVSAKLLQHWVLTHEGAPDVVEVSWAGIEGYDDEDDEEPKGPPEPLVPDTPAEIMARPEAWS